MSNFWGARWGAWRQFWSTIFPPPAMEPGHLQWSDHLVRRMRYGLLWSFYDQTIYFGRYSDTLKREFALYRNIRPTLNPCARLIDFHGTHLQGGVLDPGAGDGRNRPSCLPVLTEGRAGDDAIRGAVARVWAASNWQVKKSLYNRWGAALGDVGLEVLADDDRGAVRVRVVHPAEVVRVTRDAYGDVKSYVIERWETDPDDPQGQRVVQFRENCYNDDGNVVYETFRDGAAYAWPGTPGQVWESDFGFVPLVLVRHIDQGLDWGDSELKAVISKAMERDDSASNLTDAVRKMVNGPWLLTGAAMPAKPPQTVGPWSGDPYAPVASELPPDSPYNAAPNIRIAVETRDGIPFVTCNAADAKATPLMFPVPVEEVVGFLRMLGDAVEQDYPELQADKQVSTGDLASGRALEEARQKAVDKIEERRAPYDEGLVLAHKMAMAIGGTRGYPGFEAFGPASLRDGTADHAIGGRPVFKTPFSARLVEETARSNAVKQYTESGMSLDQALLLTGCEGHVVDRVMEAARQRDEAKFQKALVLARMGAVSAASAAMAVDPNDPAQATADAIAGAATSKDPSSGWPAYPTGGDADLLP